MKTETAPISRAGVLERLDPDAAAEARLNAYLFFLWAMGQRRRRVGVLRTPRPELITPGPLV